MKEKPRDAAAIKPAAPAALPWSRRARAIASVLIVLHVFALFVAPWSMPPPASELSGVCADCLRPYLHLAFIYHGYRFFAPNPGASHIVQYELEFADGRKESGQFPNLQRHWPRLLYHRHFMLSETIFQATGMPPEPPPPPPNLPPRIKQRAMAEYAEALKQYDASVKNRDALVDAVAQRLLLDSGAAKVRLWATEHAILSPQQVLDGMSPTQEETYIQRPLGQLQKGRTVNLLRLTADYFRELYAATLDGWNRFWFTPADPATLGLVRLFAGSMIFYTHLVWTLDLAGFFGPQSRISPAFARGFHGSDWAWSPWFYLESPALMWTFHIAALVVLAMFAAGLFTRITSVLAFLLVVAYAHRVPGTLFGLDQINGLLALYLMIGPSGAAFSLDNLLRRKAMGIGDRGSRTKQDSPAPHSPLPAPSSTSANIAIRLIQVHMCIVYLFAGFGKLLGETWWAGTAMWGALGNYEYQSLDMTWLAAWPLAINFLSHLTIAWECSYSVFVWPRLTRPIVLALAVPLHMGIALCMGMITFGLVMLIGNLAFVSPSLVRAVLDRRTYSSLSSSASGENSTRS